MAKFEITYHEIMEEDITANIVRIYNEKSECVATFKNFMETDYTTEDIYANQTEVFEVDSVEIAINLFEKNQKYYKC